MSRRRTETAAWRREQRTLEREIKKIEMEAHKRGYTRLRLQVRVDEMDDYRMQIDAWLRENIAPDRYLMIVTVLRYEIAFAYEADAVHALLRWWEWMKKV